MADPELRSAKKISRGLITGTGVLFGILVLTFGRKDSLFYLNTLVYPTPALERQPTVSPHVSEKCRVELFGIETDGMNVSHPGEMRTPRSGVSTWTLE